jgi:hypothetical protein
MGRLDYPGAVRDTQDHLRAGDQLSRLDLRRRVPEVEPSYPDTASLPDSVVGPGIRRRLFDRGDRYYPNALTHEDRERGARPERVHDNNRRPFTRRLPCPTLPGGVDGSNGVLQFCHRRIVCTVASGSRRLETLHNPMTSLYLWKNSQGGEIECSKS